VSDAVRAAGGDGGGGATVTREVNGDTQVLTTRSGRIRTLDDALTFAEVDRAVWEVERYTVNSWEMGFKDADGNADALPVHQVKVWLRRKASAPLVDALDAIYGRIASVAPAYPPVVYTVPRDPHMLEVSLFDVHLGKLAWHRETGDDYDLDIAEAIYERAIADLLCKASPFSIDRIVFPVGQDLLHIDNTDKATSNGTVQDVDGRLAKIIEVAQMAVVRGIDRLREVAPVEVVPVPGNHDAISIFHLARFLWAYYRNCPGVTVDVEPRSRKYVAYGCNLIGYTHGDQERAASLPAIMATEVPQLWAATQYHEWHLGHYHKKRETQFVSVDTHDGVTVRVLPSLSGRDEWHYSKGYTSNRLAEAYLWSHATGPTSYLVTNAGLFGTPRSAA
jgi:hypothetical protein